MDKVFIKDLEIETIIGIFGWEREVKQIVKISLEMSFDISKAGKSDQIEDALDYKKIGKSIVNLVENSSFFLVEKMAEEIAKLVLKNKQIKEKIVYVGDGINDSPSIKQADIGITTSSSSQIAQVAGDILIHKGGLDTISDIFKLSKKSKSRIYQNLFLAFIYNTSMIPLAVSGAITPNLAALAMALSSISVVLNSSRKL